MSSFLEDNSGPIVEVSENTSIIFSGTQDDIGQILDGNKGDITVSNNGNTWTLNDINENVNVITGAYSSNLNQAQVIKIINKTSSNLTKANYKVVRARTKAEGGAQGQRLAVLLAQANTKANHTDVLGLVAENINNNQEGFVLSLGMLNNINTTGSLQSETWVDGDVLWLSDTVAGGLTNIEPTTHPIKVGFVVYANQNNGKIFVKIEEGLDELEELHNVTITNPQNNDVVQYESSTSKWKNQPLNKSSIGLGNVDNTSDVDKPISTATQTALDSKVDKNPVITGATKTKITYNAEGLVTAGTDADIADISGLQTALDAKQATLVSGTNIKTIENQSLLGSGNIDLDKSDFGLGNVDNTSDANKPISTATQTALDSKVDKIAGKGLSTEDYTTTEKNKLAGIETGAEVNVQSDWNAASGDAFIANKPVISGTNTGDQNLFSTIAVSGQSNVVADSTTDTLTLVAGSNITLTTNATNDSITIEATGGGGGSAAETFETVSKNLKSWGGVLNYTNGVLTSIVYTDGVDTITKTLNYTNTVLTSIVLSGDTPAGIDLTKTLGYTNGSLTSITYS